MSNIVLLPNQNAYDWAAENIDAKHARLPAVYEQARQALETCQRIDECQTWADKAEALASYARQRDDETLLTLAKKIQGRATRRCGELLAEIPPQQGANQNIQAGARPNVVTRTEAAEQAGMSEWQKKQALRVAAIPADEFEAMLEQESPPTITALAERGTKKKDALPADLLDGIDPVLHVESTKWLGELNRMAEYCEKHDPKQVVLGFHAREFAKIMSQISVIGLWIERFNVAIEEMNNVRQD